MLLRREVGADYARSSRLEWLETNGLGSYAMGTVAGANTRRYHGHFVAALRPPVDRHVLLAKFEETLIVDEQRFPLSSNQYPGAVHPDGFSRLVEFRSAPFPRWTFEAGGVRVEKRLFMPHGRQSLVVRYLANRKCRLEVQPLVAFRDHHALASQREELERAIELGNEAIVVHGVEKLRLFHDGDARLDVAWHFRVEYLEELARGFDFREDLLRVATIDFALAPRKPSFVVATIDEESWDAQDVAIADEEERTRRGDREGATYVERLSNAAQQFVVRRDDESQTVIAGYPWFTDWGRDSMIAIPGLLQAGDDAKLARDVIDGFLDHLVDGLIPNRFPDRGEPPEYATADATLWMFQAARAYVEASHDLAWLMHRFWPCAEQILEAHERGTKHGIVVDPADGLLRAGDATTSLTWMDARIGEPSRPVTSRHGKPVEINALYYNALRCMERWGDGFGATERASAYGAQADRVQKSFADKFWNASRGCLYDVVSSSGREENDARVRPNQIFAVALPFPLLSPGQRESVVRVVEEELLTDMGLRTLAPTEPGYLGRYEGNAIARDSAYHQGTVWPWLLGPFVRAYLVVHGTSPETLARCRAMLAPLERHLDEGCVDSIAEVFDGDAPQRPGGCPAQAWSVSEILRLLRVELA